MPGWQEDISGARNMDDLPPAAVAYVAAIEDLAGAPIAIVSVGPERTQTIRRRPLGAGRPGTDADLALAG